MEHLFIPQNKPDESSKNLVANVKTADGMQGNGVLDKNLQYELIEK